ncbi:MAG: cytochrome c3 family protein [Thermoanaerobaculia bacterium]
MRTFFAVLASSLLVGASARATPEARPAASVGCVDCHLALDDPSVTPPAKAFADDVHARAGFTCASCHGGDPRAEDQEVAHDRKKGFRGKPSAREVPLVCGTCHADAAAMKHFNPSMRVDQLSEYRSSGHGKKLSQGDETVATCASCHGAHGILPVKDARSPVYPTRIAQTCNRCHGDPALMAAHNLPADVYAQYTRSVHHEALAKKGDLSAPTCNSCHGNHGAAPPQVGSVANVCGTCHAVFADQFKASPHWEAFAELGLPGCVTCHENHLIVHPTDAFLSTGKDSRCASCHEPGSEGAKSAAAMYADLLRLQKETGAARASLAREAEAGMEVSRAQFDLARADEALTKARADVHLFQPYAVEKAVTTGLTVARAASAEAARIAREREFRRKGLFVSLGLIFLAIVGLVAKIRDLDRRRVSGGP